jgi:hypothetical protein
LRNYAWVARRFAASRRRVDLSFQHHAELASLDVDEQDDWLRRTKEYDWTVKQLRNARRQARGSEVKCASDTDSMRRLIVPSERFQRWQKAAEQTGADFQLWITSTLDEAAEQILTS